MKNKLKMKRNNGPAAMMKMGKIFQMLLFVCAEMENATNSSSSRAATATALVASETLPIVISPGNS